MRPETWVRSHIRDKCLRSPTTKKRSSVAAPSPRPPPVPSFVSFSFFVKFLASWKRVKQGSAVCRKNHARVVQQISSKIQNASSRYVLVIMHGARPQKKCKSRSVTGFSEQNKNDTSTVVRTYYHNRSILATFCSALKIAGFVLSRLRRTRRASCLDRVLHREGVAGAPPTVYPGSWDTKRPKPALVALTIFNGESSRHSRVG